MTDATPLPSRERFDLDELADDVRDVSQLAGDIVQAYADGRLVDREPIDETWLCIEQVRGERRISNLPGNEGHCFFTSKPNHLTTCGRFLLVAAALGDTE